ncbi:MAG TPA: N-methyl-D-aspartate receptor NMDAR2C subunit [Clostridia bacterium]|nr:N-methyl-D-aspartate receptor NMDAR2C subunit [Clostridia bacterium]
MNTPSSDRWARLWRQVAAAGDPQMVYRELISRYSEPHRHYHNLEHLAECLIEYDSAWLLAENPIAVELAIWFHDSVYDPHARDNEERSAELARLRIEQAGGTKISGAVAALVLATKTHDPALHPDAPLLVDVDLSILGKSKERFREYEAQIRREYEWVPESTFAVGRARILEKFLARQRIYATELFFSKYEQRARINLQNSISNLIRR